jgi:hypothetical protein
MVSSVHGVARCTNIHIRHNARLSEYYENRQPLGPESAGYRNFFSINLRDMALYLRRQQYYPYITFIKWPIVVHCTVQKIPWNDDNYSTHQEVSLSMLSQHIHHRKRSSGMRLYGKNYTRVPSFLPSVTLTWTLKQQLCDNCITFRSLYNLH